LGASHRLKPVRRHLVAPAGDPVTYSERRRRRPPPRRRRSFAAAGVLLIVILAFGAVGFGTVATNAFGAGDLFDRIVTKVDRVFNPVPERSTRPTVEITAPPTRPTASPDGSAAPSQSLPIRAPVDVRIVDDPEAVFAHEARKDWCAPAGVQMTLAVLGKANTSEAFQSELHSRVREWESKEDSRNGEWGPAAMALALDAYGAPGYEIRAYKSRSDAVRDAAIALTTMRSPAILLAWKGAHTWVMTGYAAEADPTIFPDAIMTGAYILDPWYPWNSNIWGQSDPPGAFQDWPEMERNFLPWKRPEGTYPDRDGKYIILVPTIPAG
jgi:hypothetical protein